MTIIGVLGTAAAICTTGAFVPQILKIRKQGGKDLSYSMLLVYLLGVSLWLGYGLLLHAPAVIWANALAVVFVGASIVLKAMSSSGTGSQGRRLRIAVDMDEVIADALTLQLALFNDASGLNVTPAMIEEKGRNKAIPAEFRDLYERIPQQEGFFRNLAIIEGSQRALQLLSADFDVFIATAAMDVPSSFNEKFQWLQEHFPFIPKNRIVFCGNKEIVNADYLVDDSSRHFVRFGGKGILFTAPHNVHEQAKLRANSWDEVLAILQKEHPISGLADTCNTKENRAGSLLLDQTPAGQ